MVDGPLADVKVLELGHAISAPYCGKLLADSGAEVIKIEPPGVGDPSRKSGPFPNDEPHPEKSGLFLHLNLNKKSITLDLRCRQGKKMFKELLQDTDILVENLPADFLPDLGLGYKDLETLNPQLVMTSITPFGKTGPYRGYKSQEIGVFAMSGRMYTHGLPDREPLRYGPDISWFQTGATAAAATLAALYMSRTQGVGQEVDVSAVEALVGNMDSRPLYYAYTGNKCTRGNWSGGYPQGAYPCKDGYVVLAVGYDPFFGRLCQAMDLPELAQDSRFASFDARALNRDEFEPIFLAWTLDHTKDEIFKLCQAARVLCSPLLTPAELLDDPQLAARNYFVTVDHPVAGTTTYPGPAFRTSIDGGTAPEPAPTLGQHNLETYCGKLGYSQQDLCHLRSTGVI